MSAEPPPEKAVRSITIEAGSISGLIDEAEEALLEAELGLYQMNGAIVRVGWISAPGGREQLRVTAVDEIHLQEMMGRAAEWRKFDARARKEVLTRCPADVARAYISRGPAEWKLPRLAGIIDAPTLRPDGSRFDHPGHDGEPRLCVQEIEGKEAMVRPELDYEPTGLLLAYREEEFPSSFGPPGWDEAYEAAELLLEPLTDFPFVAGEDAAVAIAAILTAAIRRSLPSAPLFAFTAPTPGTGKSHLVNLVHMIATGRTAPALTWTGDPQEDRKAIDSALLEGASSIAFDNVTGVFGGDRLNQVLTERRATLRPLGQSRTVEVECRAFITATGNNLTITQDMTRRTMLCRLDAGVERPELRAFAGDPLAAVRADRGRYHAAALTILEAYHLAGRPDRPAPLGSFEEWSSWVRGAVMWLGFADPVASMDAAREGDPTRSDHLTVMEQWAEAIGDQRVSSAQIIAAAQHRPEFREALLAVAGASGAINTARLGAWLRSTKGRLIGTMKIETAGKRSGTGLWRLDGVRAMEGGTVEPIIFPEAAD